jgi:hypothetical protein
MDNFFETIHESIPLNYSGLLVGFFHIFFDISMGLFEYLKSIDIPDPDPIDFSEYDETYDYGDYGTKAPKSTKRPFDPANYSISSEGKNKKLIQA